jgi:hypothetical protein
VSRQAVPRGEWTGANSAGLCRPSKESDFLVSAIGSHCRVCAGKWQVLCFLKRILVALRRRGCQEGRKAEHHEANMAASSGDGSRGG